MDCDHPIERLVGQYILCNETKDRRLSQPMRKYSFLGLGALSLIQTVELAIISLDNLFVQHHMCSELTESFVTTTVIEYFSGYMVNEDTCLIDPKYMEAFMTLTATKTETFARKFTRMYRKAMVDQIEWIHSIFKNSPQYVVNNALHNFILGETTKRLCDREHGSDCPKCVNQDHHADQIFWFIRSGFVTSSLLFVVYTFVSVLIKHCWLCIIG